MVCAYEMYYQIEGSFLVLLNDIYTDTTSSKTVGVIGLHTIYKEASNVDDVVYNIQGHFLQ